jgi:hypothetical protein
MSRDKDAMKAWRLSSQQINPRRLHGPGEVVKWLCGVQAQDYGWAKWSIGLRLDGCKDETVERAIQDRRIVRTWMFRGTLHFVGAEDLAWLTSLVAPRVIKSNARRYQQLELDDAAFVRSQNVIQRALDANGSLTRSEIKTYFENEKVPAEGQQVPYLLQRAALDGLICQGLQRGNEPTYVLQSDWIGTQQTFEQAEGLWLLAARYFSSHGPATQQDFGWWSGLTAGEVRRALDHVREVMPVELNNVRYWGIGDPPLTEGKGIGYLLPPFDEYLLGYKGRSLVLDSNFAKRVNAGGGVFMPTVMVNGEIVGIWAYKLKRHKMVVSIQPFRNLESHERDVIDRALCQFSCFKSVLFEVHFCTGHVS